MLLPENVRLLKDMFYAKRVPLGLLSSFDQDREFHREDWQAVQDTVDSRIQLKGFDFYFDQVAALAVRLAKRTTG